MATASCSMVDRTGANVSSGASAHASVHSARNESGNDHASASPPPAKRQKTGCDPECVVLVSDGDSRCDDANDGEDSSGGDGNITASKPDASCFHCPTSQPSDCDGEEAAAAGDGAVEEEQAEEQAEEEVEDEVVMVMAGEAGSPWAARVLSTRRRRRGGRRGCTASCRRCRGSEPCARALACLLVPVRRIPRLHWCSGSWSTAVPLQPAVILVGVYSSAQRTRTRIRTPTPALCAAGVAAAMTASPGDYRRLADPKNAPAIL